MLPKAPHTSEGTQGGRKYSVKSRGQIKRHPGSKMEGVTDQFCYLPIMKFTYQCKDLCSRLYIVNVSLAKIMKVEMGWEISSDRMK